MRGPKPPAVSLTAVEREALVALARGHRTPQQQALRARIILAAGEGANNTEVARQLGLEADTARRWRMRRLDLGAAVPTGLSVAARLEDAPRPGGPCRITAAPVCGLTALACAASAASDRPMSHWSGRELAEVAVARGIVDRLSARHAGRLLKRGRCSPIAAAAG
jgi:putative transposase